MAVNLLGQETSPYLLQHADNPVHWYPWGKKALNRAVSENMPIFLSIGYSACHWCHVMAHESFENSDIADVMNANFVNIKVDREERPDVDAIYQEACQRATGQGGWPLSVFLTPDQKPFYVGTYFPVLDQYGRPGFGSLLRQLAQAWREDPGNIKKSAEKFTANLDAYRPQSHPVDEISRPLIDEAAMNLLQAGDPIYGGFGSAPKFPNAANISFLFRYARFSGMRRFAEFGLLTLTRMARGGMFDQVGGGFHRYSTDRQWLVPHFEKMLYDNALIPVNYAEAYQITKDTFYLDTMRKTLDFLLREFRAPEGAFYSALDADSEGEEGRFYVWSKREIKEILGEEADLFCLYYDVTDGGNWEGKCILYNNIKPSWIASKHNMQKDELELKMKRCRERLLESRGHRIRPGLDDKILTSWNAMAITAMIKGYRVSGDDAYADAALETAEFIIRNMLDADGLYRTYKDVARIRGFLEDYAYTAAAMLDVFESRPDLRYLDTAVRLGHHILTRFWDGKGGFFMTPTDHESLIFRPKSEHDLSIPSGSSVAIMTLIRLYHLTGEMDFMKVARQAIYWSVSKAAENPYAYGYLLNAVYLYMQGAIEVTVMDPGRGTIPSAIHASFIPESIMVHIRDKNQAASLQKYPFFAGKPFRTVEEAYVCKDATCSPPLTEVSGVMSRLDPGNIQS